MEFLSRSISSISNMVPNYLYLATSVLLLFALPNNSLVFLYQKSYYEALWYLKQMVRTLRCQLLLAIENTIDMLVHCNQKSLTGCKIQISKSM